MKHTAEVHFRVIDHGIFLPIARRLAREGRKVTYWTPHEKAFPTVRDVIGDGFDDIERVKSIWQDKDSVDCWVFCDVGFSGEQRELLSQGKIVWGPRDADSLEIYRGKFLETLVTTDLKVPPYVKIVGMEALRDHLRDKQEKYIKISQFRGDWETLHWRDWEQDELELDARAVKLGPFKELLSYYVCDQIDAEIEDGCDTYCVDGKFPSTIIHGVECKDRAYLGTFQRLADLPEEVRCVNDAFGPILGGYGYRAFFSSEVRITKDKESYFTDPTLRAGSPPSQVMCEMIGNLGEIIWKGAQGELVEPEQEYRFGVQALLCVEAGRESWRTLTIPDEIEQWAKFGFCSKIGDQLCFPPDPNSASGDIGWLLGVGNTPGAAIEHLKKNVEQLPCGVACEFPALAELIREVDEAEKEGMEFTDKPMPDPAIVIEK